MTKTWLALAGFALVQGCAASLVPTRPNHVFLRETYEPAQVRDAIAHIVTRHHYMVDGEQDDAIRATDNKLGCAYAIQYGGRAIDISVAPAAPAAGALVDARCLDASAALGKTIVKELERPAKLAVKEEKRRRRAERFAAATRVIGAGLAIAGNVAGPIAGGSGSGASEEQPAPSYHYGVSNNSYNSTVNTTSNTNVTIERHQVKPFFVCPMGRPQVCSSQRAADDCSSYGHCSGCRYDAGQQQFCP